MVRSRHGGQTMIWILREIGYTLAGLVMAAACLLDHLAGADELR